MMSEQEVKQLLIDTQAILEGHFLLTSGLHSPMYVEKFNVLQHPKYTETLCKELAERFRDQNVELVIGRPITQAENPREAVRLIIEEMENVSK